MKNVDSFLSFVRDQLDGLEELTARRMFGGVGLYCGSVFFGIVHGDVLYLKVNDHTRSAYTRAGMKPFKPFAHRPTTLQYYEVPAAVLEDEEDLKDWARRAIAGIASPPAGRQRRR